MRRWVALLLLLAGCAKPSAAELQATKRAELLKLGLAYHQYTGKHLEDGPHDVEELKKFGVGEVVREKVKAGEYFVFWNFPINQRGREGTLPRLVLGYERDARLHGGLVLMGDGRVQEMTADELTWALKP